MPKPGQDPRVYFAAERTMLAWLRTGIAIMAFGFVVARFGLFLRLLQAQGGSVVNHGVSPYLGTVLVGLGVLATAGGAVQYQRYCRTLPPIDRPATSSIGFVLGLSWALVLIGVAATYFTARPRFLGWASEMVLPFYVLHHPVTVVVAAVVVGLPAGLWVKFGLILLVAGVTTVALCVGLDIATTALSRRFGGSKPASVTPAEAPP